MKFAWTLSFLGAFVSCCSHTPDASYKDEWIKGCIEGIYMVLPNAYSNPIEPIAGLCYFKHDSMQPDL